MSNKKVLVADDEPMLRQLLSDTVERLWPELDEVLTASNGQEALELIEDCQPAVVFLDVKMPGLDGLEVAKRLGEFELTPLVVFVTAYDHYAVEAFDREAVDYLVKPVDEARLAKTISRLKSRLSEDNSSEPDNVSTEALLNAIKQIQQNKKPEKLDWIKAVKQDNVYLISPEEVYFFQAEDKYTNVVTKDNEYIIRTSVKQLKEQLDESQFMEIRRGTLVNSRFVERFSRDVMGRMSVHFKGIETILPVSRSLSANFKHM